jgi:hypothetical protein
LRRARGRALDVSSMQSMPAPSGSTRCAFDIATCYTEGVSTELIASAGVIEEIRRRGGALYVWPRKARYCGGTITLEAATEPPPGKVFRLVETVGVDLFIPIGMMSPETLHVEISRRGRVHAFWNGLAWVEATPVATDPMSLQAAPPRHLS